MELLRNAMVPKTVRHREQIGLCAPQERGDYSVGVWLYDIRECTELKSHEMVTIDKERQLYPPIYVNLYYMITAYSAGELRYRAQEEALMLGKIIQTFHDAGVMEFSRAGAADGAKPVCQIVRLDLSMEEKLKIYHVPDGTYKTSLFYEVGPLELTSERQRSVRRVKDISYTVKEAEEAKETG